MITGILISLAADVLALVAVRFLPKSVRYTLARPIRRYANWVSPDNF